MPVDSDEAIISGCVGPRQARSEPVCPDTEVLRVGEIAVDVAKVRAYRAGLPVHLGPTEFRLLVVLMTAYPAVIAPRDVREALWGDRPPRRPETLNLFVSRLRRRLCSGGLPNPIWTICRVGFALDAAACSASHADAALSQNCHRRDEEVSCPGPMVAVHWGESAPRAD